MDAKTAPRVRDPDLFNVLHLRWHECVICGDTMILSLHHVNKHPRDDLEENLVMLCGSGTTGCHGRVELHDPVTCSKLSLYIRAERPDTIEYLDWRFPYEGGDAWLMRTLGA